jgi:hypothetical protein
MYTFDREAALPVMLWACDYPRRNIKNSTTLRRCSIKSKKGYYTQPRIIIRKMYIIFILLLVTRVIGYWCDPIAIHPSIHHLFFLFLYFWFWLQFAIATAAAAGTLLFLGWGLELITSSWNRWGILVYLYDSRVWIFWPVTFHISITSFVSFRLNILNSRFGNVVNVSGIHELRRSMGTFHTPWRQWFLYFTFVVM